MPDPVQRLRLEICLESGGLLPVLDCLGALQIAPRNLTYRSREGTMSVLVLDLGLTGVLVEANLSSHLKRIPGVVDIRRELLLPID